MFVSQLRFSAAEKIVNIIGDCITYAVRLARLQYSKYCGVKEVQWQQESRLMPPPLGKVKLPRSSHSCTVLSPPQLSPSYIFLDLILVQISIIVIYCLLVFKCQEKEGGGYNLDKSE